MPADPIQLYVLNLTACVKECKEHRWAGQSQLCNHNGERIQANARQGTCPHPVASQFRIHQQRHGIEPPDESILAAVEARVECVRPKCADCQYRVGDFIERQMPYDVQVWCSMVQTCCGGKAVVSLAYSPKCPVDRW